MSGEKIDCYLCFQLLDGLLEDAIQAIDAYVDKRGEMLTEIQDLCSCGDALYHVIKHYKAFLSKFSDEHNVRLPTAWRSNEIRESQTQSNMFAIVNKLLSIGFDSNYVGETETALMIALSTHDKSLVHLLLANGSNPNLFDGQGQMNALAMAIILNDSVLVDMLLRNGAKANEVCCCNMLPLQLCMNKKNEISKSLLDHDAVMQRVINYQNVINVDLTLTPPLFQAIFQNNVRLASILLEHGENVNEIHGIDLDSPLHAAVKEQSYEMIQLLVNHGANLDRVNGRGHTPFGLALVTFGNENLCQLILSSGCSLTKGTVLSLFQRSYAPLHISAFLGKLALVKFIIEECVPKQTQMSSTMFGILDDSESCKNFCSDQMIKYRVQALLSTKSSEGTTPLYMAVFGGFISVAEYLIEQGSDPSIVCYHGNLIHAAVLSSPNIDVVNFSLRFDCDINLSNSYGNTPLLLSSRINKHEICELLMHHGALVNIRDSFGETPLSVSVYFGCIQNAKVLIQHGANVNLADARGTTPLYWSIFNNRDSILQLLLLAGADFTYNDFHKYQRTIKMMRNRTVADWLGSFVRNPRSLQNSCVLNVRDILKQKMNGCSIVSPVASLPLPAKLRKLLLFSEFTVSDDHESEH